MIVKLLEVRDKGTFIPVMAIKLGSETEAQRYLLSRAGYGQTSKQQNRYIMLCRLEHGNITSDAYDWPNRTMHQTHLYLNEHFDEVENGQVIDVQFIIGETREPKKSESVTSLTYEND